MNLENVLRALGLSDEQIFAVTSTNASEESGDEVIDQTNEYAEKTAGVAEASQDIIENAPTEVENDLKPSGEIEVLEDSTTSDEMPIAEMVDKLAYELKIAELQQEIEDIRQRQVSFESRFKFTEKENEITDQESEYAKFQQSLANGR